MTKFNIPRAMMTREDREEERAANEARLAEIHRIMEQDHADRIGVPLELQRLLTASRIYTPGHNGGPHIDARTLHSALNVRTRFNDWWRRQVEDSSLILGRDYIADSEDFYSNLSKTPFGANGRPETNYLLTLEAARMVSMTTHSTSAKLVRRWIAAELSNLDRLKGVLADREAAQEAGLTFSQYERRKEADKRRKAKVEAEKYMNSLR